MLRKLGFIIVFILVTTILDSVSLPHCIILPFMCSRSEINKHAKTLSHKVKDLIVFQWYIYNVYIPAFLIQIINGYWLHSAVVLCH